MQTDITDADTLETLNTKLRQRRVVLMRLARRGKLWHATGSRTDTFIPAHAYGRCPAVAVRRLAACLDPAGA